MYLCYVLETDSVDMRYIAVLEEEMIKLKAQVADKDDKIQQLELQIQNLVFNLTNCSAR